MSESINELNDEKTEESTEPEVEPSGEIESSVEADADEQPVQVDADADAGDQAVQSGDRADAEIADSGETADEEAPVKNPEQPHASEEEEQGENGPSVADFVIVSIFAVILGLLLCLPTLLGSSSSAGNEYDLSGGTATSINGVEIGENDVSSFVASFRMAQGLEDDGAWGQWLVNNGYTPETLRLDVIEYYTTRELLAQAAKEQGVEVSDADVDAQIASIAEQLGGEEAFANILETQGVSMESYRESIALSLSQERLADIVTSGNEAITDDAVLEMMKMYFPDQVSEDAESLEGLDPSLVDEMRSWLKQQAFSDWMDQYRVQSDITVNDMPEGLPYVVDISGLEMATDDLAEFVDESQSGEGAGK